MVQWHYRWLQVFPIPPIFVFNLFQQWQWYTNVIWTLHVVSDHHSSPPPPPPANVKCKMFYWREKKIGLRLDYMDHLMDHMSCICIGGVWLYAVWRVVSSRYINLALCFYRCWTEHSTIPVRDFSVWPKQPVLYQIIFSVEQAGNLPCPAWSPRDLF